MALVGSCCCLLSLPCGQQWVCEQRYGPGLSIPWHRLKQQDVLLRECYDNWLVLLPSTFQLDLKEDKITTLMVKLIKTM